MAENDPRPLTRAELAKFLPNQRAIRAFEKLFDLIPPDLIELFSQVEAASLDAGISHSKSNEALAQLARIATALEVLTTAPPRQKDTFLIGDYIDLPFQGPHIQKERRVQWNDDDGTLDVGLYGGSVLQVGQEIMYYAKNADGSNLSNGTPVMFSGTVGASSKLTFEKAVADGTYPSDYMMGVITQDIDNNAFGYVTSFGVVRGLRTDGVPYSETWNDGDLLYFDPATAGTWTNIQPSAPNLKVPVAVVLNATSGNSGSIFVRMTHNEQIGHLQDVEIASVADGDLLQYSSANSRWENVAGASGSFTTTDGKTVTVTNGIITNIV
jgi:hypothetical protein